MVSAAFCSFEKVFPAFRKFVLHFEPFFKSGRKGTTSFDIGKLFLKNFLKNFESVVIVG